MERKTIILGGGTFYYVRNHLALAAPAFGRTARRLNELMPESDLVLTKMADQNSNLVTNEEVKHEILRLIEDPEVKVIILNVAFCDFDGRVGNTPSGRHALRLETLEGRQILSITPAEKIIPLIREMRKDIFLVGFKTTTDATEEEQFQKGLKLLKNNRCNLVLANDTVSRNNMIITPEESYYCYTMDRELVLKELVEMIRARSVLTFHRTNFIQGESFSFEVLSNCLQQVLSFVVESGGYILNENGFTAGHFCQRIDDHSFYSSQRKTDHNKVEELGVCKVEVKDEKFTAHGAYLPSVGARSQWLLLKNNPAFDCIVHTHNPLKEGSPIPTTPQKMYQCGSLECGLNTLNHLGEFDGIKAVYLEKHGAHILFKSTADPYHVIRFIEENIALGVKTS